MWIDAGEIVRVCACVSLCVCEVFAAMYDLTVSLSHVSASHVCQPRCQAQSLETEFHTDINWKQRSNQRSWCLHMHPDEDLLVLKHRSRKTRAIPGTHERVCTNCVPLLGGLLLHLHGRLLVLMRALCHGLLLLLPTRLATRVGRLVRNGEAASGNNGLLATHRRTAAAAGVRRSGRPRHHALAPLLLLLGLLGLLTGRRVLCPGHVPCLLGPSWLGHGGQLVSSGVWVWGWGRRLR